MSRPTTWKLEKKTHWAQIYVFRKENCRFPEQILKQHWLEDNLGAHIKLLLDEVHTETGTCALKNYYILGSDVVLSDSSALLRNLLSPSSSSKFHSETPVKSYHTTSNNSVSTIIAHKNFESTRGTIKLLNSGEGSDDAALFLGCLIS
jgi:hypothetical protein